MSNDYCRGIPFDASETYTSEGEKTYDYVYYAQDLADWMKTYFKNGVLVPGGAVLSTQLQVSKIDDTHVSIAQGNIVVEGRTCFIDTAHTVEIEPTSELQRYDRIVIELNLDESINQFRVVVLQGLPDSEPSAPVITYDDSLHIYQMSLAKLYIDSTGIVSVSDERADEALCGISQVLIGVHPPLPVTGDSAANISYDSSATYLSAENVQDAIDELATQAGPIQDLTLVLTAAGWDEVAKTQTISNAAILLNGFDYIVSPASAFFRVYSQANIYAEDITRDGEITFHCNNIPESDITISVLKTKVG